MMQNYKSWLFAALFMLFGMLGAQAQDFYMVLALQHVESDFVPADECNYYRHFFTLENESGEGALNIYSIQNGADHFVLYRNSVYYAEETVGTPVADLYFTMDGDVVNYEITYQNQEPLADYDLDLVTAGTLPIVQSFFVDLESIVLVDQFTAGLSQENDNENFIWKYNYFLQVAESDYSSNVVQVNNVVPYSYNLGFYTWEEIWADTDAKLTAGVKNAEYYFDRVDDDEDGMPVKVYSILRGDNTYPSVEISHMTAVENNTFVDYVEESEFLPEYYGVQEHYYSIARNDSSKVVTGGYGDFMTYVPVMWTDGEDRVKQDGDNSYGGFTSKTGVAGLDVLLQGTTTMPGSSDSWLDENGQLCLFFNPVFYISATMPKYATWEYTPVRYRIWKKCSDPRYCVYENGQLINDTETERETFELIEDCGVDEDETQVVFGDPESYIYEFGATAASAEDGISFLIRMYYQVNPMIPLKYSYPSWMPVFYVVETEVPWSDYTTGATEINTGNEMGKTYYNLQGIASDKPYDGLNIVVTHYSDGSTKTTKVMR